MKNNVLKSQEIKTFLAIGLSLVAILFITPQIFIVNTPRIKPSFLSALKNAPSNLVAFLQDPFGISNNPVNNRKQNAKIFVGMQKTVPSKNWVYRTVQKGIQIATDPITKQSYAVFDDTKKFKTIDTVIDGKVYKAIVPQ